MTDRGSNATAEYLAALCGELAALAERDGLKVGAHLLKMAQLEFAGQAAAKDSAAEHATH